MDIRYHDVTDEDVMEKFDYELSCILGSFLDEFEYFDNTMDYEEAEDIYAHIGYYERIPSKR